MIAVMPTHAGLPQNSDPALDVYPVQELIGNIVPTIEKQFRVLPGSKNRAIAGLSAGGNRTHQSLLQIPTYFDYFCPLSTGFNPTTIAALEQNHQQLLLALGANRNIKLIWMAVGRDDALAYQNTQAMRTLFDKYGIEYTYHETAGAHMPDVWRHNLNDFAPLLFR